MKGNGAIACLGWGSLIWDPGTLPRLGPWLWDGPTLPLEFTRESGAKKGGRGNRITLVITPGSAPIRSLWIELDTRSLNQAREVLARREGIPTSNHHAIGHVDCTTGERLGEGCDAVAEWARERDLTGVVWTNLSPKFNGEQRTPSVEEVCSFLNQLDANSRQVAEAYVRLAPRQIDTAYRSAMERDLGWGPVIK